MAECIGFMIRANSWSEWIWPWAGKLVVFYSCCNVAVSIGSVSYCWFTYGYITSDRVFHSMNFMLVIPQNVSGNQQNSIMIFLCVRLPWNQTTLHGYLGEAGSITIFGDVYASECFTLLMFFVSICLHHQAFYKMFKHWIDQRNRQERNNSDEVFLCDLIRFHIMIKAYVMS